MYSAFVSPLRTSSSQLICTKLASGPEEQGHQLATTLKTVSKYTALLAASEKKIAFQEANRMLKKEKEKEEHAWLLILESSDLFG